MYIFKFFIDYAKEEKWLNEMAKKGYEIIRNSCGYKFKPITPQDITYRIDYRTFKCKKDFIDYCTLFEDSGWKHIAGTKSSGNQYFKKVSSNSDSNIFSDNMSKAARYKRVSIIWLSMSISYLILMIGLVYSGTINLEAFINPKALYFTPGLWEKSGLDFLRSFLFETPFALARGFSWLALAICIIMFLYFIFKASKLYKEAMKQE